MSFSICKVYKGGNGIGVLVHLCVCFFFFWFVCFYGASLGGTFSMYVLMIKCKEIKKNVWYIKRHLILILYTKINAVTCLDFPQEKQAVQQSDQL